MFYMFIKIVLFSIVVYVFYDILVKFLYKLLKEKYDIWD